VLHNCTTYSSISLRKIWNFLVLWTIQLLSSEVLPSFYKLFLPAVFPVFLFIGLVQCVRFPCILSLIKNRPQNIGIPISNSIRSPTVIRVLLTVHCTYFEVLIYHHFKTASLSCFQLCGKRISIISNTALDKFHSCFCVTVPRTSFTLASSIEPALYSYYGH
jgi:hypothetical protein